VPFARRAARGFTLIEVVVALAVSGLVVLMAHRVLASVADGVAGVTQARTALDREQNGRRLLASLLGSLYVENSPGNDFSGDSDRLTFSTWAADAEGRMVRSRVTIEGRGPQLVVQRSSAAKLILLDDVLFLDCDYLLEYGAAEHWARRWFSSATAPAAVRLRLARRTATDTLLFLVGVRG